MKPNHLTKQSVCISFGKRSCPHWQRFNCFLRAGSVGTMIMFSVCITDRLLSKAAFYLPCSIKPSQNWREIPKSLWFSMHFQFNKRKPNLEHPRNIHITNTSAVLAPPRTHHHEQVILVHIPDTWSYPHEAFTSACILFPQLDAIWRNYNPSVTFSATKELGIHIQICSS
jgi:hypothetical protein